MAAVLLGLGKEVKSQFTLNEVDSSNIVFKLFAKATFGLCLLASILVVSSEYLGNPITCEHGTGKLAEGGIFTAYCWIHGGKKLTHLDTKGQVQGGDFAAKFDCKSNQTGDDDDNTLYYQWVAFMLAINALLFKIPHILWKSFEGGIMKKLHGGKDSKSALNEAMEQHLTSHEASFKKLSRGRKSIMYYTKFQICQILNLLMLVLNWWITNQFVNELFTTYGSEVVTYYSKKPAARGHNPMCNAFPTVVGCSMTTVETAGTPTDKHGICILSQNVVNEKIYLFLWFWFVFMFVAWSIQFIFEIAILAMKQFRSWLIELQSGSFDNNGDMKKFVEDCNLGDWFILYQIGKNTNDEFFYKLIKNLSNPKGDDVKDTAPLIVVDSGNGMELKHRNQAEKPE